MSISSKAVIPSYFHDKNSSKDEHIVKFEDSSDEFYEEYEHLSKYENRDYHCEKVDEYEPNTHIEREYWPNNLVGFHDTEWDESDLWELWDTLKIEVEEP